MQYQELSDLVKKAQGKRTAKKYAEEAGVDSSTLYRTLKGIHRPGIDVLQKLANHADPNSGVTIEMLVAARGKNGNVTGKVAAMTAMTMLTTIATGLPGLLIPGTIKLFDILERENENSKNEQSEKEETSKHEVSNSISTEPIHALQKKNQQFSAIASGVVYSQLAQKGIRFRPGNKESLDYRLNEEDSVIFVEEEGIEEWVFSIVCMSDEDKEFNGFIKKTAPNTFIRFFFLPENKKRKISIVVNDEELYKVFAGFKGSNCYRGNVSVILVDEKQVRVVKEEYIAYYDTENPESNLTVV